MFGGEHVECAVGYVTEGVPCTFIHAPRQLDEWIETFQEAAAVKESEYDINVTIFQSFRNHSHQDNCVKNIHLHFAKSNDQENTAHPLICLANLKQKFLTQFFFPLHSLLKSCPLSAGVHNETHLGLLLYLYANKLQRASREGPATLWERAHREEMTLQRLRVWCTAATPGGPRGGRTGTVYRRLGAAPATGGILVDRPPF